MYRLGNSGDKCKYGLKYIKLVFISHYSLASIHEESFVGIEIPIIKLTVLGL